ncbi:2-dehydro-3-deoxygluconokinase [Virgibacillus profundi]|uniref:2-dehydro-3-deoxygluconokinase n=1 Tax=Virgibacillus profundi TaxID=2024555 RepID=A0A2A2IAC0_9BACI|nr:sugar kinase [Virgibacillus profundi]PAV28328.1 2-dehydro-3-deoxygluconokinase [Virgibacillus profundi]PXY52310.1 sugar kinase [Virgibacillus profundi]
MDVVTIGESMVLFTPDSVGSFIYTEKFNKTIGGAESNVAIALSRLGHEVGWVSRLGTDDFGLYVRNFIRGEGVDTSNVLFDNTLQTAVFFKERKDGEEPKVYYYRENSAISHMKPDDLNEDYIANAKYLHLTGITPALSESCKKMIYQSIHIAKKHNVKIIFDPNIRLKLWSKEEAREVINDIASLCDVVLPGIEEGKILTEEDEPDKIAKKLLQGQTCTVVIKLGKKGAYFATKSEDGYVDGQVVDNIVDPIGAGDGFAAGFISAMIREWPLRKSIDLANRVAAFALTVPGDAEGYPYWSQIESNSQDIILR